MRVFRITFGEGNCSRTIDIQSDHIGTAIGLGLKYLREKSYTYKIEDCLKAEVIATPVKLDD